MTQVKNIYKGKRSKGCEACRKRKIKCDETRPHCQRCFNSQIACPGYRDLGLRIADQTEEISTRVARKQAMNHGFSVIAGDSINRAAVLALLAKYSFPEEYMSSRSAKEPAKFRSLDDNGVYEGSWSPFAFAIAACAYTHGARMTNDESMAVKGLQSYYSAITGLQKALQMEIKPSIDTVSAIGTLAFYEAVEDPTGNNAMVHEFAVQKIMQSKGPEGVASGKLHELFIGIRTNAILTSLARRKASQFASPEWITTPWKTEKKTELDKLLDIVAALVALLEYMDRLQNDNSTEALEKQKTIQQAFHTVRTKLSTWYNSFTAGKLYDVPAYASLSEFTTPTQNLPKAGFVPLKFCSLQSAQIHTIYWATCLELSLAETEVSKRICVIECTDSVSSISVPQTTDVAIDAERIAADYEMASSIAASVPFCLKREHGVVGPAGLVQPMSTAISWFQQQAGCEERLEWCTKVFQKLLAKQTPLRWLV